MRRPEPPTPAHRQPGIRRAVSPSTRRRRQVAPYGAAAGVASDRAGRRLGRSKYLGGLLDRLAGRGPCADVENRRGPTRAPPSRGARTCRAKADLAAAGLARRLCDRAANGAAQMRDGTAPLSRPPRTPGPAHRDAGRRTPRTITWPTLRPGVADERDDPRMAQALATSRRTVTSDAQRLTTSRAFGGDPAELNNGEPMTRDPTHDWHSLNYGPGPRCASARECARLLGIGPGGARRRVKPKCSTRVGARARRAPDGGDRSSSGSQETEREHMARNRWSGTREDVEAQGGFEVVCDRYVAARIRDLANRSGSRHSSRR